MNILEMFKQLNKEEKEEFILLIIKEINNTQEKQGKVLIIS